MVYDSNLMLSLVTGISRFCFPSLLANGHLNKPLREYGAGSMFDPVSDLKERPNCFRVDVSLNETCGIFTCNDTF